MLKRSLSVLLVLCCMLGIVFCCQGASASIFPTFMLTQAEIDDMCTYMNRGFGAISGKWFYGDIIKNKKFQGTGKIRLSDVSDKTVLFKEEYRNLCVNNGWLYYITPDKKNNKTRINKVTISGENKGTVVSSSDGEIQFMFIYDEQIYYAENVEREKARNSGKLCRIGLDGSGKKTILNKPVYFPYIVDGKLLYQDDLDRCRLHMCDLDGSNDCVLIDDVVYSFVTIGDTIYYKSTKGTPSFDQNGKIVYLASEKEILKAYDLKSGESKKVISNEVGSWGIHDDTIYYTNADDSFRIYTQGIYSGDVDVMAQDKNVDLDVFGNGGIFCMSYTDAGKGSGYFYISYDTFSKTDLMK